MASQPIVAIARISAAVAASFRPKQNSPQDHAGTPEDFDFEAFYQDKSPKQGWVQPECRAVGPRWTAAGPCDIKKGIAEKCHPGCGLRRGGNALFLTERGYRVCGFEYEPTAIEQTRNVPVPADSI